METIVTTKRQVEIERTPNKADCNYRIVWGNPLTGEQGGKVCCNWLKINNYGAFAKDMVISEHGKSVEIQATSDNDIVTGVNIALD
jgi:hypothetical protein